MRDQDRGGSNVPKMKCFKCGHEGHHQATCSNPPLCYSCHSSGHIAANCPMSLSKRGVNSVVLGSQARGFTACMLMLILEVLKLLLEVF